MRLGPAIGMMLGLAIAAPRAQSQQAPWLPRLQLDNDAYNFWMRPGKRPDEEYSNGVVASVEALRAPWWGRRLGGGRKGCGDAAASSAATCLSTVVSIGQDIYTPNLDRPPFATPEWRDERPYAAWLWAGGTARFVADRHLGELGVALGVTGAPALGRVAQGIAHQLTSGYTKKATGWETQVGFQPGVQVSWRESFLAARTSVARRGIFDFAPFAAASLGSVLASATAGARARIGLNLSHPWDPRGWRARPAWEAFLSAAGRDEYVARNFSLDGTLVHPDRRVDRVSGVPEYEFGIGLRVRWLSLGYRAVTRGREYTTGPARHTWSSMIAAVELAR